MGSRDDSASLQVQIASFIAILVEMLSINDGDCLNEQMPRWLTNTLSWLDPTNDLPSMETMARTAGLPYHTFRRRFKQHTGVSPMQYRTSLQIEAAKSMLQLSNSTIREIAAALKFTDEFHFSNRFNSLVGMRPSVFRRLGTAK